MKRYLFLILTVLLGLSMNAAEYKKVIYVNPNGKGDFTSIVASLEAIRAYMDYEVTVHIANGVYN
ncbi:MAG: pectin esterase, partial [Muribaculaceae bacterium]|nr:pectin esterase [Muribaculaceae bacterium]